MDFKRTASITLNGVLSAAEVVAAAASLPGFKDAVLNAVQEEASKSAGRLVLVDRQVTSVADDGSATVNLVFESTEAASTTDTATSSPQVEQQAAQESAAPPILPLSLQPLGLTPAGA